MKVTLEEASGILGKGVRESPMRFEAETPRDVSWLAELERQGTLRVVSVTKAANHIGVAVVIVGKTLSGMHG